MTLKLEVGKTYVTRAGDPVKIDVKDRHPIWPFNGSNGDCFREDGRTCNNDQDDPGDLVSELQEPVATASPALSTATVAFHRQQFLDALMLELVRQGEGLTSGDIADTFKELVEARDSVA